MIQHVRLNRQKQEGMGGVDWQEPMELIINADDYKRFKKTIKTLFDCDSVKLIKKARHAIR